ncbi:hypothetical protein P7C73_g5968, partial [Tremellales sp. Uapishka_1]
MLNPVAGVAAVVLASERLVQLFAAVSSLTPPHRDPAPVVTAHKEGQATGKASRWRRPVGGKRAKACMIFLVAFAIQFSIWMFVSYAMPRLFTETGLNFCFGLLAMFMLSCTFFVSIDLVLPVPSSVKYAFIFPKDPKSTLRIAVAHDEDAKSAVRNQLRPRMAGALLLSSAVIWTAYLDSQILSPVTLGAFVTMYVVSTNMKHNVMSIKWTIAFLMGLITFLPLFCLTIGLIVSVFIPNEHEETPETEEPGVSHVSLWLLSTYIPVLSSYAYTLPGALLALTLRFEHKLASEEYPSTSANKAAPGALVPVPRIVPTISRPLFKAGLVALFIPMMCVEAFATTLPSDLRGIAPALRVFTTVPFVIFVLAATAWMKGQLGAWWHYREVWKPTVAELASTAEASAEGGLAHDINEKKEVSNEKGDEKAPLLVDTSTA